LLGAFRSARVGQAAARPLSDAGLRRRLAGAAATIRQRDGVRHAADLIEETALASDS